MFQYRQSSQSDVASASYPRYRGRGYRLLPRPRYLREMSQGSGAVVGGGERGWLQLLAWVGLVTDGLLLQGAGHNDVELYNQYLERLKTFVAHELTN